ncbi:hypothetical protein PDIDSM_4495 [Penicillium digitatum]|nr:hypothetical protein PDIDSM_4495 [Penicillium digitatum]
MKLIQPPIFALILLPATITGLSTSPLPIAELQVHRPHWTFDLFHNKHCVGTTVTYAGQGSSGCRSKIENGGAEAFINVSIDPSCKVELFRDKKCSRHAMIEEIKTRTTTKCKPISRKKAAQSFEVSCQ